MAAVEIVAHRGASSEAPENTLAAIALAWQQNADAVEVDVQLSRDGELVVIHDQNTWRTTGVDRAVAGLALVEIKQLDAGRWRGRQCEGERIPTLDEVLALIPAGKRLFIELKGASDRSASDGILKSLQASLARTALAANQLVLIGFDYELMKSAKDEFPEIEALWLRGDEDLTERPVRLALADESIALCHNARLHGLDLSGAWLAQENCGQRVKEAGLKLCVYTVNDLGLAQAAVRAGVDSITTDRPAWLRKVLGGL